MTASVKARPEQQNMQANQPENAIGVAIGTVIGSAISPIINNSKVSAAASIATASAIASLSVIPWELKLPFGLLAASAGYFCAKSIRLEDERTAAYSFVDRAKTNLKKAGAELDRIPALETQIKDLTQTKQELVEANDELVLKYGELMRNAKDLSARLMGRSTQASSSSPSEKDFYEEGVSQSATAAPPAYNEFEGAVEYIPQEASAPPLAAASSSSAAVSSSEETSDTDVNANTGVRVSVMPRSTDEFALDLPHSVSSTNSEDQVEGVPSFYPSLHSSPKQVLNA